MKSFVITKNDAGQRLDKFVCKTVPRLPSALMYKYIRTKRIKVNSKRAEISTRLCENDTVDMYIGDEFFEKNEQEYDFMKAPRALNIIYEDGNILLLDKKAGVLCHPDGKEYVDTLIGRIKRYLYEKGEYNPDKENSFTPALANRIDRNTSGIVIAAKNAESLRILNEKIKSRELHKFYLCVTVGTPPKKSDILTGYLYKDEKSNTVRVSAKPFPDSKTIKTKYTVLDSIDGLSLVDIELLTGRTHQIRAHMASLGCPLLGDGKYGSNKQNKKFGGYKKQLLCSYRLQFDFTSDAGILGYLDGRSFETGDIWFREEFYKGNLV
ncbi:MAG: RluA family pseudouridine synthase [Ruminococcaceae bacterium]|nr:RluA family pseudouridine synthase [Oscillospiraceae bacterium]